jgi:hypothetical protein
MIDELPPLDGLRELWGHAVFQCPYCHGWEMQDRAWGYLARAGQEAHLVPFALQLRAWTDRVTVFTSGELEVADEARRQLAAAGVGLETAPVRRLIARGQTLAAVALAGGAQIACDALFHHPPQRQVDVVRALGVALDADGFVQVDPVTRATSVPGVSAAGDLTSRMQAAIAAAASGMHAAAMLNLDLTVERVTSRPRLLLPGLRDRIDRAARRVDLAAIGHHQEPRAADQRRAGGAADLREAELLGGLGVLAAAVAAQDDVDAADRAAAAAGGRVGLGIDLGQGRHVELGRLPRRDHGVGGGLGAVAITAAGDAGDAEDEDEGEGRAWSHGRSREQRS